MRTLLILFLTVGFTWNSSQVRAQIVQWKKSFGGPGWDMAHSVTITTDGGYAMAGISNSNNCNINGPREYDIWVVRLNPNGDLLWSNCFGGSGREEAYSIQQTSDGGFIVAGSTNSNDGDVTDLHLDTFGQISIDTWVIKLGSSGSLQWQKCLGGPGNERGFSIKETTEGGYIVAGSTTANGVDVSGAHGNGDYWVVKLSGSGNILWQKCLGGTGRDEASDIQQTTDGGFIVAGISMSDDGDVHGHHGNGDSWIVRLNNSGDTIWTRSFGGSYYDYAWSVTQTFDGGFIAAGLAQSYDGDVYGNHVFPGNVADYWVIKLDISGNLEWQKCLGGFSFDQAYSIIQTSDSAYVIAGGAIGGIHFPNNYGDVIGERGDNDYWIVKISQSGNILWSKCFGGSNYDIAMSVKESPDKELIVAGYSRSNDFDVTDNHGGYDYWILKLLPDTIDLGFYHQLSNNGMFITPQLIGSGSISSQNKIPFKISADGSTASFIEFYNRDSAIQTNNIYFKIKNSGNPNEHGEFLTPVTVNGRTRKAVLRHPNYFNAPGYFKRDTIQITDGIAGNIICEYPLQIYRAPVLMIHGLWADASSFDAMWGTLLNSNKYRFYNIFTADYSANDDNARDFFTNRYVVKDNINHLISMCLEQKISTGKVDIVSHSMGGILARLYLQSTWHTPGSDYRDDIHKLITINTPHSGSQMANYITSPGIYSNILRSLLEFIQNKTDFGAIDNLKVNGYGIDSFLNGNTLNAHRVPSTTVQTIGAGGGGLCTATYLGTLFSNSSIFNNNPNDLIVELESQKGGIILTTLINDQCHTGSPANPIVISNVMAYLEADGDNSSYFTNNGFQPPDLTSNYRANNNQPDTASGTIHITDPVSGQTFNAGATIPVAITGDSISKILLVAGNKKINFFTHDTASQNATFQYVIPEDAIGNVKIIALGGKTSDYTCIDTISINVSVTATLDEISIYPDPIYIHAGEYQAFDVYGYFSDDVVRYLNSLPDVNYTITDTTIAAHDTLNAIRGVGAGTTTLVISYLGETLTVPVIVSPTDIEWVGIVSTDWTNGNNWSRRVVPGMYDVVTIPAGTTFSPFIPSGINVSCKKLTIRPGATLTVGTGANLKITQ